MNRLSDQEIKEYTEEAKGINCAYSMLMCSIGTIAGWDSGTCSYIYSVCTGSSSSSSTPCSTCTCH